MNSFITESRFFSRQIVWIIISLLVFFIAGVIDWRFLRKSLVVTVVFIVWLLVLLGLFVVGHIAHGAQSWFSLGGVSFQPADLMKIVLIMVLAKYFSRRHIEIAHFRHLVVSGLYAFIPFVFILLQPDFGSAIVIFSIWLGLVLVAGVSPRHLFLVFIVMIVSFLIAWFFLFAPYQKDRILNFIHPLADIRGTGYNAFQSTIAVGSGQVLGKGLGYGTQSRLAFLPEYQTDFIFAAFAEEWGLIGVLIVFFLFGVIIWRLLKAATLAATNFESLFTIGVAIMIMINFLIHVGMNSGLLPVTGLPLPFMSYGGSHLLTEFLALGMAMGMRRYSLSYHRDDVKNEFIGPQ